MLKKLLPKKLFIYTDDAQILTRFSVRDPDGLTSAIQRVETCLTEVSAWLTANKLMLTRGKQSSWCLIVTSILWTGANQHCSLVTQSFLPTRCIRNLGVTWDSELSMLPYINQVIRAGYYHLSSISRIRWSLDDDTCAMVVRALVISRLDYANSMLCGVPDCALRKLLVLQNDAAQLVTRTRRRARAHITPVLGQLHWLPVRQRITHKLLSLTFKALYDDFAPVYLQELLQRQQKSRVLRSNSAGVQLHVPRTTKRIGDRAFSVAAPREWNALPQETRSVTRTLTVLSRNM